jgi:hypothetical protein
MSAPPTRTAASAGFDRLRPRTGRPIGSDAAPPAPRPGAVGRDRHGKRALYSGEHPPEPHGPSVTVTCSRCGQATAVGARRALAVLAPSLHLPLVRPRFPSLLRCPACHRVSWVRLALGAARH